MDWKNKVVNKVLPNDKCENSPPYSVRLSMTVNYDLSTGYKLLPPRYILKYSKRKQTKVKLGEMSVLLIIYFSTKC